MTRPNLYATARLIEDYANLIARADQILTDEWLALDWHPASTLGDGTPHGTSEHTPVERAVLTAATIEADRAQLEDDARAITILVHDAITYARTITARGGPPPKVEVPRCNGKIDPTCTNAAAELRDQHGSRLEGLCEQCALLACRGCYQRETMPGRTIEKDGRRIPSCEACARKEWRATRGAA